MAPPAGLERASPLPIIADHSPKGEAFTRSQCFRYTAERRASLPYGATLRIPLRGSGKHCKSLCRPVRAYQIKTRKPKTDRGCGLLLVGSPCWARAGKPAANNRGSLTEGGSLHPKPMFQIYRRETRKFALRSNAPYSASRKRQTLQIPLSSGTSLSDKNKKTKNRPRMRSAFGWLPLLGSNQRHRD